VHTVLYVLRLLLAVQPSNCRTVLSLSHILFVGMRFVCVRVFFFFFFKAPVITTPLFYTFPEEDEQVVTLTIVDVELDAVTVTIAVVPNNGQLFEWDGMNTVALLGTGSTTTFTELLYRPNQHFFGSDEFQWYATDTFPERSDEDGFVFFDVGSWCVLFLFLFFRVCLVFICVVAVR
jgi:hypothetical protein